MSLEYIQQYYDVPACMSRRVEWRGRPGIIIGNSGPHVAINFDDEKPGSKSPIHPRDPDLKYLEIGKIRKMTRSQERYQEYLNSECCESFAEWMGFSS